MKVLLVALLTGGSLARGRDVCGINQRVKRVDGEYRCRACPVGATRAAGDVVGDGETSCDFDDAFDRDARASPLSGSRRRLSDEIPFEAEGATGGGGDGNAIVMSSSSCKARHPDLPGWGGGGNNDETLAIIGIVDPGLPAEARPTAADVRRRLFGPEAIAWLEKISDGCLPLLPDIFIIEGDTSSGEDCSGPAGDAYLEYLSFWADEGCDSGSDVSGCPADAYNATAYDRTAILAISHCAQPAFAGTLEFYANGVYVETAGIFMGFFAEEDGDYAYSDFPSTWLHEVLHTLGAGYHNNLFECVNPKRQLDDPTSCAALEYGDAFDVMGTGNGWGNNLNAFSRWRFGWLGKNDITVVKNRGTVTLSPLNAGADAPHPRAAFLADAEIWLEWRTAPDDAGEDAGYLGESGVLSAAVERSHRRRRGLVRRVRVARGIPR